MAFIMKGPGPQGAAAYNVEQAVGANAPNASSDVRMVQYMLRHIFGNAAAGLAVDGWIGPVTISWIQKFQNAMKAQGHNVLADGRVDRAFGKVSSVSKTIYTILLMNQELKKKNPSAWSALPGQVALSETPKSNPYNPKAKVMKDYKVVLLPGGKKKLTYTYTDGTTETVIVAGNVVIDGQVIPGVKEIVQVIVFFRDGQQVKIIQYSDGSPVEISYPPLAA
jgi:hypothetical protein